MHTRLLPLATLSLLLACGSVGKGDEDEGGGTDTCNEVTVYDDLDKDGFGNPDTARLGCADDRGVVLNGDDCLDSDPRVFPLNPELCINGIDEDCDGVADDGCHVEWCGEIAEDTVWEGKFIHDLTCDVSVGGDASPTVVIEDGAQVFADAGVAIRVGEAAPGRLSIEGGDLGLFLDPSDEDAGWEGIVIGPEGSGSTIAGAFIRDARAPLHIDGAEVEVTGTAIERAQVAGVQLEGAARLRMSGSTIRDGADDAVVGAADACLDGTATFTDNVIEGNAGAPIRQPAQCYRALDASSSYTGNGDDAVHLSESRWHVNALITGDHRWQHLGVPVTVSMSGSMLADGAATLLLEGGLDLTFEGDTFGPRDFATIDADGGTERISIHGGSLHTDDGALVGVDFERAVLVEMGRGSLEDVTLTDSIPVYQQHAVQADRLVDVDIVDCRGIGLRLEPSFHHMDGVRVSGCTGRVGDVAALAVPHLDAGSSFTGNAEDHIVVGTWSSVRDIEITEDTVWPAVDVQLRVADGIVIAGDEQDATLTLSDGLRLYVRGVIEERLGSGTTNTLIVDGHTEGVEVESDGLVLQGEGDTRIDGLTHIHGRTAIDVRGPGIPIRDCTLRDFYDVGIKAPYAPDVQGCTLRDAHADATGVVLSTGSSGFTGNTFINTPTIADAQMDTLADLLDNNDLTAVTGSTIDVGGTLSGGLSLPADFIYRGFGELGSGASLTLAPGTRWEGNGIAVAPGGILDAIGTASDPIVFTSEDDPPASGDWWGLTLYGGSTLQHVEVEYAGASRWGHTPENSAIELLGPATIRDTTVRDSLGWCIARANAAAQSATLSDNSYDCVWGDVY
jgi:hypothetical protein